MRISGFARYALSSCVAAAMLASCGGSQAQIAASPPGVGLLAKSASAINGRQRHRASGSYGDLTYASGPPDWIYMLDYPSGNLVGDFKAGIYVSGMCTDTSGNVYILGYEDFSTILKYAHGATKPTSTITLHGYDAFSCAVDPTTGDLAVLTSNTGDQVVAVIYPGGSGSPTYYTLPVGTQWGRHGCTYDDSGDLFVEVQGKSNRADDIAELPEGGSSFSILTPNRNIEVKTLQWVSSYLAAIGKGVVYRLAVSGSSIQVTGDTKTDESGPLGWIQDSDVLIALYGNAHKSELAYWNYPKGGKATKIIQGVNKNFKDINGVAISAAGSH
jgi:hypothetical protein